jgi:hypothetical protein
MTHDMASNVARQNHKSGTAGAVLGQDLPVVGQWIGVHRPVEGDKLPLLHAAVGWKRPTD